MKSKIISRRVFILLMYTFVLWPNVIQAATVTLGTQSEEISVGDNFIIEILLQSPDELINVVDGSFMYNPEQLRVEELSTGGSIF